MIRYYGKYCVVIGADGKGTVLGECRGDAATWNFEETAPTPAPTSAPRDDNIVNKKTPTTLNIVNKETGQCLGTAGSSFQLQVSACDGSPAQQWSRGMPASRNFKNKATGRCMDNLHGDQFQGNSVGQYRCNGYEWGAQVWNAGGSGTIQYGGGKSCGLRDCLVIGADGKGTVLGTCSGDAAMWNFEETAPTPAPASAPGYESIVNNKTLTTVNIVTPAPSNNTGLLEETAPTPAPTSAARDENIANKTTLT